MGSKFFDHDLSHRGDHMKKDTRSKVARAKRSERRTMTRAEKRAHNVEANAKQHRLQRLQLQKLLKQYAAATPPEEHHDHHSHQHESHQEQTPLQGQAPAPTHPAETVATTEGEAAPLLEAIHPVASLRNPE